MTADGKLTSYAINSASKIVGSSQVQVGDNLAWFTLIKMTTALEGSQTGEVPTIIAGINSQKSQVCLYQVK